MPLDQRLVSKTSRRELAISRAWELDLLQSRSLQLYEYPLGKEKMPPRKSNVSQTTAATGDEGTPGKEREGMSVEVR